MMAKPSMRQLRDAAKKSGINSFGKTREDLETEVGHLVAEPDDSAGVNPPARVVEAMEIKGVKGVEEAVPRETRTETRPTERETTGRRSRVPLGVAKQKLSYPPRVGYHRRWFNDRANRIADALDAGYTFVEEDQDGRRVKISRRVGVHEDGSPMMAHLMEIRQEFYDEDQREKQKINDAIDDEIMRRNDPAGSGAEDRGRFYTPSEGRNMSVET